ncbi:hypothetical protein COY16_03470 [Candidatus Roizmanbacteria bacterium CG_4_10_14_0_2_um_filter_39_13]|uniref:Uncharacterized protein n=1 Tax=Candidatus Roizmanbacteria bacterium CG_4_10_14_0_2_um_filter_39_13 TaxID=1974825 RepID=A0A2M7TY84_9BACT|nr:MAG: hypothetical protein COY16_03470 [Candidatus Roizmanbacteria bacterium CG_4_10_14_0_2_um_filter_39_13]
MALERGKKLLSWAGHLILGPRNPEQTVIGHMPANIEIFASQVGPRKHFVTESGQPMECFVGDRFINAAVALQRPEIQPPSLIQLLQAFANTAARHALSDERKNSITQEESIIVGDRKRESTFRGDKTFVSATTVEEDHPDYQGASVTTSAWYINPTDVHMGDTGMHCFGENAVQVTVDHTDGSTAHFQFEMCVDSDVFQIMYKSDGLQTQGGVVLESMPRPRMFSIQSGDEILPQEQSTV